MKKDFRFTVETSKAFDRVVQAIEEKAAEKGFRVLHTHDVAATLAEKGFPWEPLKIVEVCNARYASEVLEKDINVALMLPCPIAVRCCRTFWQSFIHKLALRTSQPRSKRQ